MNNQYTLKSTQNYKSLSQQWNNLIKQLKTHSKPKMDLPPIIFHKKSPLENYKNALKLHQSLNKKKTINQKIIHLQKRRKISTININEHIKHQHKRFNSQGNHAIHSLTDQQKQLLNTRQFHQYKFNNSISHAKQVLKDNRCFKEQKCKQNQTKDNNKVGTCQIMKQIKAYHQDQLSKQSKKPHMNRQTNMQFHHPHEKQHNQFNSNSKSNEHLLVSNLSSTIDKKSQSLSITDRKILSSFQHSNCCYNEVSHALSHDAHDHHHNQQTTTIKRKLAVELSKDYKSLRFRYDTNQKPQQQTDSIAKMLIKNRKQKVQHIFSIFTPSKSHQNNNHYESQRLHKQTQQSECQQRQRYSQIELGERNSKEIKNPNNQRKSVSKMSIHSAVSKKKQSRYHIKKQVHNSRQMKKSMRKGGFNVMHEQPWDQKVQNDVPCTVGFTIQNYHQNIVHSDQGINQSDKIHSKSVIIM